MIAGTTTDISAAAEHIHHRISHGTRSGTWYVWREKDEIHYCSGHSKVIFNDADLIGTYARYKRGCPSVNDVKDDIDAAFH